MRIWMIEASNDAPSGRRHEMTVHLAGKLVRFRSPGAVGAASYVCFKEPRDARNASIKEGASGKRTTKDTKF
jgi:hypothetical protein